MALTRVPTISTNDEQIITTQQNQEKPNHVYTSAIAFDVNLIDDPGRTPCVGLEVKLRKTDGYAIPHFTMLLPPGVAYQISRRLRKVLEEALNYDLGPDENPTV